MKKMRIVALLLVLSLLLGGCSTMIDEIMMELGGYTSFSNMAYSRPDVAELSAAVDLVQERLDDGSGVSRLMDAVFEVYGLYNAFCTNYSLAQIHYSKDLTDIYWEKEHSYCMEKYSQVTALVENMLYALADCPLREELEQDRYFGPGFFDAYEGENVWTETFTALTEQEAKLVSRYYELQEESQAAEYLSEEYFATYGKQMAELYVELVALRQQIAKEAGYADYPSFAYDFYYYRDYTPQQALDFTEQISRHLTPIYRQVAGSDVWAAGQLPSTEEETLEYVRRCADAMGGEVYGAFQLMRRANLYDITYSEKKYAASFEIFLPSYYEPYVFVCPDNSVRDRLTFAHEFGHFCSDYAAGGSIAGVDVAEVFSLGMEYLSLSYAEAGEELEALKLADGLCIYIEQAAYAWFEQQVYSLEGDALTVSAVEKLHYQMGTKFGLDVWQWDYRSYVCISHFFTNPFYVISYVVSNDAALQLYEKEQSQTGAGLQILQDHLATQEAYFLAFLESADLESPFEADRILQVKELFTERLLNTKNKGAAAPLFYFEKAVFPVSALGGEIQCAA